MALLLRRILEKNPQGHVLLLDVHREYAHAFKDIAEVINPMKMFEYMAAGRPILSADLPSIREVLSPENAIFCEPGDPASWRAAIETLLQDPARRAGLASAARAAVEKFTWVKRAENILKVIMSNRKS